jgi:voltage-gated potassium channel
MLIVARANRTDAEPKLRLAGANRIISPYTIGGRRMASLAMRPTAVEFVDTIMSADNADLLLEDLTIPVSWAGRALSMLSGDTEEAIILALKRGEKMMFRPSGATVLAGGDEVVAAGPAAEIHALEARLAN